MAMKGNPKLTNRQRVRLGRSITKPKMKSIALGYLDLDKETIKNIESENQDDAESFNRDVIEKWENKNSGGNQIKVSGSDHFRMLSFLLQKKLKTIKEKLRTQ